MTYGNLQGWNVLVVEDEYFVADELHEKLRDAGATVLGPVPRLEDAAALISTGERIDAAVLDINLQGEMVFPVADLLRERQVPFAFATGYDAHVVPDRFADAPRIEKPFKTQDLTRLLADLLPKQAA